MIIITRSCVLVPRVSDVTAPLAGRPTLICMSDNWQETTRQKKDGGVMATLVQILTLGIAEKPEMWEVEYKNRVTGKVVRGAGPSVEAAEKVAQERMA